MRSILIVLLLPTRSFDFMADVLISFIKSITDVLFSL